GEWAMEKGGGGMGEYTRFLQTYPNRVWVPQAQTRLTELEQQNARSQETNAHVSCPQLEERVHAYTDAVDQVLADMDQLSPEQRQRPRLNAGDLPHLPRVFDAIRGYQRTVASVQATYGTLPPCHVRHREI